ncbi:uncharacterized protein [Ambystoma mexicanum]|uniref:uncharacterized protein n=1 Tax=Ambystoma mexicanum TaxID=8296 RepID=UPI0037E82205
MNKSKKKVSFHRKPVYIGADGGKIDINTHSRILQSYFPFIVRSVPLTTLLYRRLNERGVLTTDQIGQIELQDSTELKVSKLIELLKTRDSYIFSSFCDVIQEMGYQQLAQSLRLETTKQGNAAGVSLPSQKHELKEVVLAHNEYEWALKEENMRLHRRIQFLKNKYQNNLKQLEEKLAFVRWQRDLAFKEQDITRRENEELQKLNNELQALITRLEATPTTTTPKVTVKDFGVSVDFLPRNAHMPQRRTHLALLYR